MISFQEILEVCQAQAISDKLTPNEISIWRKLCRSYSKKFHTPLYLVEKMDVEHVILNVYEDQLDTINHRKWENLQQLLEAIYSIEDPNYESNKEKKLEDDIARYEAEEEERQKKKSSKKVILRPEQQENENIPKGGFVDLSGLQNEEENN